MSDFKPGEIVDITIKGVRIRVQHSTGSVSIEADAPDGDPATWEMPPQAAIARVAPPEWPPREGDLWRDRHGELWFIYSDPSVMSPGGLRGRAAGGERWTDQALGLIDQGPLTLVHREAGPDDEDDPKTWTGPDGRVWDLTIGYTDDEHHGWHWAGGFFGRPNSSLMWPLMSRDDWSQQDKLLFDCPELTPVRREATE